MDTRRTLKPTRSAARGICVAGLVCLTVTLSGAQVSADTASATKNPKHPATKTSASTSHSKTTHGHGKKSSRTRGQQKIDSDRARQIQEALVREHYLSGDATGNWNQSSEEAMRHFQADHGWQTKTVPDSRALIALGLGPNQDHLLNPDSAMTSVPLKNAPAASQSGPTAHKQ
jgi:Putative peptidoglycan binding domain